MPTPHNKEVLRDQLIVKRSGIPEKKWILYSEKIINQLQELPAFKKAETVHCYVSMNKRREVNTHPLIKQMLSSDKQVVVPITHPDTGTLTHHELCFYKDLKPNKWGVPEPNGGAEVPVTNLDVVVIPMVGGDEKCNRIGYGGGFYDRFLKNVTCPKVGLSFEQNVLTKLPVESFDIPLDYIITEERIIGRD